MKDEAFVRGANPMTKMEVRNTIVSYLDIKEGQNVLDIGAGTGSVIIQAKKTCTTIKAYAIEKTDSGCALIAENAKLHGVDIDIIQGQAPDYTLDSLIKFDSIYIGGTGHQFEEIMNWLETHHLKQHSILVFSAITLESQHEIFSYLLDPSHSYTNVEASLIQASRLEMLSDYHYFKPLNPCVVIKCVYGGKHG